MIPNPIHKVLSTIRAHRVRALLMGGQTCVLYVAPEFSCDIDRALILFSSSLIIPVGSSYSRIPGKSCPLMQPQDSFLALNRIRSAFSSLSFVSVAALPDIWYPLCLLCRVARCHQPPIPVDFKGSSTLRCTSLELHRIFC